MAMGGSRLRRAWSGAGLGLALLVFSTGVLPSPAAGSSPAPTEVLDRDMRGEEAIAALGDRLPEVAAWNDMDPASFRSALRTEPMLWVGRSGRLLFVDELHGGEHEAPSVEPTLDPPTADDLAVALDLHSRPGAARVIVLDFDGHDYSGTAWSNGGATALAAPYDTDGAPSSFSNAERSAIYSVWQRVAEDFAPFDVDVTTKDPGIDAIRRDSQADGAYGTRLVVTPTKTYQCSCGGVAYVGVFDQYGAAGTSNSHDHYQPAWVFTAGVGTGAKSIAEAASHEVGHNLGLHHDGTASVGYYEGHGDWAPIMGVGYYRPISQWSRGEYAGATAGEQSDPDDFAVMTANGAPGTADERADAEASRLAVGAADSGLIGVGDKADRFEITATETGELTVTASPASTSPNLDIRLTRIGLDATVLFDDPPSSDSNGADVSLGLGAQLTLQVSAGEVVTVEVSGVGWGDPLSTGYSSYGSVGRYRIEASLGAVTDDDPPPPAEPPSAPTGLGAVAGADGTVTVSWTDTATDETGFEIERQTQNRKNQWNALWSTQVGAGVEALSDAPGSGTFRYRVRAFNAAGTSGYTEWVQVSVGGTTGGGGKGGGKPSRAP